MSDVQFELGVELPKRQYRGRTSSKYRDIAEQLRQTPGELGALKDTYSALASNINNGSITDFAPANSFHATFFRDEDSDGTRGTTYVKFIGENQEYLEPDEREKFLAHLKVVEEANAKRAATKAANAAK